MFFFSSKSKSEVKAVSTYGEQVITVDYDFNYLGTPFDYKGQFYKTRKKLMEQQIRPLVCTVTKKSRNLGLPVV